jgi:hypothetical protein
MKFLSDTISNHQNLAAALIAVLVLVIIVLGYFVMHYRKLDKAGFEGLEAAPSLCGANWDPAAAAEAQALATAGSYDHDSYGEAGLQKAIDGAYSQKSGIPTNQVLNLMQQGATS